MKIYNILLSLLIASSVVFAAVPTVPDKSKPSKSPGKLKNSTLITNATATMLSIPVDTNILSVCLTNSTFHLSWDYNFTNNPTVDKFNIYYGTNSNNYFSNIVILGQVTNGMLSNLPPGKTYYLIAKASTTNGMESFTAIEINYVLGFNCNIPFKISIKMLTNNIPRLTTKVCPGCMLLVQRTKNFVNWNTIGITTADEYGNVVFDDYTATNSSGFYRMINQ